MAASPSPAADGPCVLCCGELEVVALGRCDHPICYRCSVRMRALCGVRYCAVCRDELAQVVFGKKLSSFSTIVLNQLQHEKKYDIYFADGKVHALYRKLLQHECPLCPHVQPFNTVVELEQHMRKQHELFCCKLCVKHLKIFTYERKWYSRKDLARHRIHGDPDDTSHRGHPLCKFCDERYLDNDELLKHLRRDHYFCHFCDSDGAQEYYSDYEYLREHFREKHFLCEEGRCSTEQFTHAFRTEIDYKAHKTAYHSKNRAEARQNRQIDLQFNYAPRHQRRNESVVTGEDYEEVERYNRQGRPVRTSVRGGQQNRRGSWRYKRSLGGQTECFGKRRGEEEDRDIAAAVRASIAAKRQEEKKRVEDKEDSSRGKKEELRDAETSNAKRVPKPSSEATVPKEAAANGPLSQDNFPAIGSAVGSLQGCSAAQPVSVKLKEEDFPSLSSSAAPTVSTGLPLTYTVTAKKTAFQEEDFPALVSKVKPTNKTVSNITSAWNNGSNKNVVKAIGSSSSSSNQLAKKAAPPNSSKGGKKSNKSPQSDDEDAGNGLTTQKIRNAPTMVDVSSLLAASTSQTFTKVGKKKKVGVEKQRPPSPPASEENSPPGSLEKVVEAKQMPNALANVQAPDRSAAVMNGHSEKSVAVCNTPKEPPGLKKPAATNQCPLPQEDFPALGSSGPARMPPPGFNSVVLLKSPPPGLSVSVSKPPPGFPVIPSTNVSEPVTTSLKEPTPSQGTYLIPEHFQQRNIQLIQSIKEFLQSDESRFNKFKTHSGQFRQGLMSAAQYYKSCRDLLGDNFRRIFNELLVLLPDTAKQQELLSAHNDFKVQEKQGSNKPRKNKKNAWETDTGADLDCCICPTCKQVLTHQDLATHKALHLEDEEFPSLQAISRIIS
ncbi:E3 ubiquitin-protein ligase ZNF598 isoform X1 [Alligator mississippiensis]|uniref:E3 ubiquitin-protein ligase ZNF598 isoform X1 n=1 Tax=Alligator mississippiensis TaxID=8496 RepID=UPI0028776A36|nr:E3 ubiquitin-protein ligase ZNF598 isoform X1 [Alligator mississippiensis]